MSETSQPCTRQDCAQSRNRARSMAAAYSRERELREEMQARAWVAELRTRPQANPRAVDPIDPASRDAVVYQAARLRGIRAELASNPSDDYAENTRKLAGLCAELMEKSAADGTDDDHNSKIAALSDVVAQRKKVADPVECAVCFEPTTADCRLVLGKACTHFFHESCILRHAQTNAASLGDHRAFFVTDSDGNRVHVDGMQDSYPAGGLALDCVVCRAPFTDPAFWRVNQSANARVHSANRDAPSVEEDGWESAMAFLRDGKHVLLLDSGKRDANGRRIAILVGTSIPRKPNADMQARFFRLTQSGQFKTESGFSWNHDLACGLIDGKAWFKAVDDDVALDLLPEGATLRKTAPTYFRRQPGEDERKVKSSGGVYKVDLPDPAISISADSDPDA